MTTWSHGTVFPAGQAAPAPAPAPSAIVAPAPSSNSMVVQGLVAATAVLYIVALAASGKKKPEPAKK